MKRYDVAVIGGGILGTGIAYWISSQYKADVCVIEAESDVAMHASSRNTGVVHSPFYLDPHTKGTLAASAVASYKMWEGLAKSGGIPWKKTGVLELALDEKQHKTLQKYTRWGAANGIRTDEMELLDARQVSGMEPNVRCHSALYCTREASTDFGKLTRMVRDASEKCGVKYIMRGRVCKIQKKNDTSIITCGDGAQLAAGLIVNCAGGDSLDIAHMLGVANNYSDLHFRGEYWIADAPHDGLAGTTIYTVAEFEGYPFLDPHWIKRADGRTEVGPNAVPVSGPRTYDGYLGDVSESISKLGEIVTGSAKKLLADPEFISLISKEWLSSISKTAMIGRIRKFMPDARPEFFSSRGTAGIRTPVISPEGRFVQDVLELKGDGSFSIINYNSPGATGAPAYSARVVDKIHKAGLLEYPKRTVESIWDNDEAFDQD